MCGVAANEGVDEKALLPSGPFHAPNTGFFGN